VDVPFWFLVDDDTRRWLAERAWCELPPQARLLCEGLIYADEEVAAHFGRWAANALGTAVVLVCANVPAAWVRRANLAGRRRQPSREAPKRYATHLPPAPTWNELIANFVKPLQFAREVVPAPPPEPQEPVDWTAVRGLGNSDCNAHAQLVRAPVDAIVDAIAANTPARTIVRDVFGKCAPFTMDHRLAFRLRGHAWTCLVRCRRSSFRVLDWLSEVLGVPVISCSVCDSSGDASIQVTENGVTESCSERAPATGEPLRVRFRGREFTGYDTYALLDPMLRSEDAWWEPQLFANRFMVGDGWEQPEEDSEVQFRPYLNYFGCVLPVEASAWIAW